MSAIYQPISIFSASVFRTRARIISSTYIFQQPYSKFNDLSHTNLGIWYLYVSHTLLIIHVLYFEGNRTLF